MRYLLDTNIVSDLIRNPQGRVAEHIRKIGEQKVCTSIIVAAELRYVAPSGRLRHVSLSRSKRSLARWTFSPSRRPRMQPTE
jgi:predicted nucleic acid-binding protein